MKNTQLNSFVIPTILFIVSIICLILGFNGNDIASSFSRPFYASSWETSGDLINALTYIPIIIGIALLIISIVTFLFVYKHKLKQL